jgi:hypothetical protein
MVYFPKAELSCGRERHIMRMGSNTLSRDRIEVTADGVSICLNFSGNQPIKSFRNSMGYSYFVPGLPCYHSVVNTAHLVSGVVQVRDSRYELDHELGYLEKNWGSSFPDRYFWLHAVDRTDSQVSILFSQAEIQWLGRRFIRHVGHIRLYGWLIDIRDLIDLRIEIFNPDAGGLILRLMSRSIQLEIRITQGRRILFKGPRDGQLSRDIPHYADAMMDMSLGMGQTTRSLSLVGNYEYMRSDGL